jgi:3-deoxy-D-manno-octulosonic-acid transferase
MNYLNNFLEFSNLPLEIHYSLNEKKMCDLLNLSEFSIVPSSGILFESLACKCKTISGFYVNNQKEVYKSFLELGAIIDAKDFNSKSISKALENISTKHFSTPQDYFKGDIKEQFRSKFSSLI